MTITIYYILDGSNMKNLFSCRFERKKSKIKVSICLDSRKNSSILPLSPPEGEKKSKRNGILIPFPARALTHCKDALSRTHLNPIIS